jgi:hypothetical protein
MSSLGTAEIVNRVTPQTYKLTRSDKLEDQAFFGTAEIMNRVAPQTALTRSEKLDDQKF